MKKIFDFILISTLVLAGICACQKWYDMVPPPENNEDSLEAEDGGIVTKVENVFVTVYGDGDMDGSSWNNAYDVDGLRTILTDRSDLSNVNIYIAQGIYLISPVEGPGIEIKKDIKSVNGGYSGSSEGTDLTKRDPSAYETIFSGDVNGNGVADSGDCAMFMVTNGKMSFNGIVFENGYIDTMISANNAVEGPNGASSGAAAVFGIFGDPATTLVDVTDCVFRGNVSVSAHQGSYLGNSSISGGACALVTTGFFRARRCSFLNNQSENRGGAIRMMGKDAALFLDRCHFSGNTLVDSGSAWGASIQLSYGHVCANNCSFINNSGKGGDVNGGGSFLFCNNTMFQPQRDTYGALRCESSSGANTTFINNLFTSTDASAGVGFNYNTEKERDITSRGYNIFQRISGLDFRDVTDVLWPEVLTGTLEDGCFCWDYAQVGTHADEKYATVAEIEDVVMKFAPSISANAAFASLGQTFFNWIGDAGFRVDQRGKPRNPDSVQKGSYDAYITVAPAPESTMRIKLANAGTFPHQSFHLFVTNTTNPFFSYRTRMVMKNGEWVPAEDIKLMWEPSLTATRFVAVAPDMEIAGEDGTIDIAVPSDQNRGYDDSDILVAKQSVVPTGEAAVLDFRHILSRLTVVTEGTAIADVTDVTVSGTVLDGSCNLADDIPAAKASDSVPSEILARPETDCFGCLIMPQTTSGSIRVTILANDMEYEWNSASAVTFESGKNYTLVLKPVDTKSACGKLNGVLSINR